MKQNNDMNSILAETGQLFQGAKIEWSKSKESVWHENFEKITSRPTLKIVSNSRIVSLGIAASLLILIGLGSFGWFYSNTFVAPEGSHITANLPDRSTVELNASSALKVFPYRWMLVRNVEFKGEGFFTVEKGKKFVVKSGSGETSVLGTSFNIYARDENYRVLCVTGKVSVAGTNNEQVVLTPNQQVVLKSGNIIKQPENVSPENIISWRYNQFIYSAAPFNEVIKEIERQYNITVITEENAGGTLSVNFKKGPDVEQVLSMVCKPLGYKFIKKSEGTYLITGDH